MTVIPVGNMGSGWDALAIQHIPQTLGPSRGDLLFSVIREIRKNGIGFQEAAREARTKFPELFPAESRYGL